MAMKEEYPWGKPIIGGFPFSPLACGIAFAIVFFKLLDLTCYVSSVFSDVEYGKKDVRKLEGRIDELTDRVRKLEGGLRP